LLVGIRYENLAKVLGKVAEFEGLHSGPPGFYFIIFLSIYEKIEFYDITVCILDIFLNIRLIYIYIYI
jgi:hypothetical protein